MSLWEGCAVDIYPEDLGPRHCRQVLEHRQSRADKGGAEWASGPSISPSGRVETLKQRATTAWFYLIGSVFAAWATQIVFHCSFLMALFFCLIVAAIVRQKRSGWTRAIPTVQRGFAEPQASPYARLTEPEVTQLQNALLRQGGDDPLLGMYLELVWAAMHLAPLATSREDSARSAREAIRALGGAIESLPPQTLEGVPDSHVKLQAAADRLASEATGESDPVVAASLGRRVEALRGQAETVARVRFLLRRNLALREELADQIGALRTSLAAAGLDGDDSGPELAGVAARIRRVASEANAVTAARVEVDTLLSRTRAGVPAAEEEVRQRRLGLNGDAL